MSHTVRIDLPDSPGYNERSAAQMDQWQRSEDAKRRTTQEQINRTHQQALDTLNAPKDFAIQVGADIVVGAAVHGAANAILPGSGTVAAAAAPYGLTGVTGPAVRALQNATQLQVGPAPLVDRTIYYNQ